MATLDAFVESNLRPLNDRSSVGDLNTDFAKHGGEAMVVAPDGTVSHEGLGILSTLMDFYDGPVTSSESDLFQHMLGEADMALNDSDIFQSRGFFSGAVAIGLINVIADNRTYDAIRGAVVSVVSEFSSLSEQFPDRTWLDLDTIIDGLGEQDDKTTIMNYVFDKGSDIVKLAGYVRNWIEREWHKELPPQYETFLQAAMTFRKVCREGTYTIQISDQAKESHYFHVVDVSAAPPNRQHVYIVNSPEDLVVWSEAMHRSGVNLLYCGGIGDEVKPLLEEIRRKNFVLAEDIRGPKQYVKRLAELHLI